MPQYNVFVNDLNDTIVSGDNRYLDRLTGAVYDKDNNKMYDANMQRVPGTVSVFSSNRDGTIFKYNDDWRCMAMKSYDRKIIATCINDSKEKYFTRFL